MDHYKMSSKLAGMLWHTDACLHETPSNPCPTHLNIQMNKIMDECGIKPKAGDPLPYHCSVLLSCLRLLTLTMTRQVLPNEQEKGLEVELCMERLSSVKAICNIKLKWALIGCKALGLH